MDQKKSRRSLRVALVLGAAVAGTALVGWGGLAAWQAYTQNSGNAFSAGTLQHTNFATGGTLCTSGANGATTICSLIVSGSGLNSSWTGTSNTVAITNTGTLSSTFELSSPPSDAPSGALCQDLILTVKDGTTTYLNKVGLSSAISSTALNDAAGNAQWPTHVSGNAGTNTFTFTVGPGASYGTDNSAPGESCSFDVLFTQQG